MSLEEQWEKRARLCAAAALTLFLAGVPVIVVVAILRSYGLGIICGLACEALAFILAVKGWGHKFAIVALVGSLAVIGLTIVTSAFYLPFAATQIQQQTSAPAAAESGGGESP
ncbi:MAG: hypothetical protein JXR37_10645 [Kiritimatiellae bacterium]|nr:hypothetical protein [Kiritimatiellia bacterium]